MLILTRKQGESFYIGDNIHVTVIDVSGDKVKISICAPKEISILRKELVDAQNMNKEALNMDVTSIHALKDQIKQREASAPNPSNDSNQR